MSQNLKNLIDQLEIHTPEIVDLRKRIIPSLGNAFEMRDVLDRQCENQDQPHCYSCDDEGVCLVITGIAYFDLGDIKMAIKVLENANQHFRSKGETWNSIIGFVLLGKVYEKSDDSHLAHIEYKKALQLLTENYIRIHVNDYEKLMRAKALVDDLNAQVTQPFSPRRFTVPSGKTGRTATGVSPNTVGSEKAYLSIFSLPLYGAVTAGPDGEVHIEPIENTFTIIDKIELGGRAYELFSIGHDHSRDRQITLIPQESYGWAKVRGLSMNGWDLPLDENDFVLFRETHTASHNDFVVVSSRDPSGDLMYIVKRYDGSAKQLLSNSTDNSQSYNSIPMTEDHKIFGIVLAVAKPLDRISHSPKPVATVAEKPSDGDSLAEERKLYNKLLTRALGNKEIIKRLMTEAYKKAPHASRLELLKIVDEDWIADGNRG